MEGAESVLAWIAYLSVLFLPISIPLYALLAGAFLALPAVAVGASGRTLLAKRILRAEVLILTAAFAFLMWSSMTGDLEERYGNGGAWWMVVIGAPTLVIFFLFSMAVLVGAHGIVRREDRRMARLRKEG